MYNTNVPVLIVGGGPVGLSFALFLTHYGIAPLLVERHPGTSIHPRARGINMRTMEILHTLGLDERVSKAGVALAGNSYYQKVETLAGVELQRTPQPIKGLRYLDTLEVSPLDGCFCAQDELEPILADALLHQECDLRFGHELIALQQDTSGVTARVRERGSGEEYTVNSQYLIAADGPRSFIRQELGIGMQGRGTLGYYVNIYFRADLSALVKGREFGLCQVQNADFWGMLVSVNNTDRWQLHIPYESESEIEAFTPEHCKELIRKAIGLPQLDPEILSVLPWENASRVSDHYQSGRIFLAGDAVHVIPPAGGFGMNTGIQDAQNIAWKLGLVLKGQADPTLLATYDAERRPVALLMVKQAGLRYDSGIYSPDIRERVEPKRIVNDEIVQDQALILGYRYHSTAILAEEGPTLPEKTLELHGQPGSRAPHVWLEQRGQRISTLELFGNHFVLLCGNEGSPWVEAAQEVGATLGLELDAYRVGSGGDLQDPEAIWQDTYGVTDMGAVIVRPDGFVGWRAERLDGNAPALLDAVLKQMLCRM